MISRLGVKKKHRISSNRFFIMTDDKK